MNCSEQCFQDAIAKRYIREHGSLGTCDLSGATGVKVLEAGLLRDLFEPLLKVYESSADTAQPRSTPDGKESLFECIQNDKRWRVFSVAFSNSDGCMLLDVIRGYGPDGALAPSNASWFATGSAQIETAGLWWAEFSDSIKHQWRFFPRVGKHQSRDPRSALAPYLPKFVYTLEKGKRVYRARIGEPELRYTSKLLGRLPASTVFFASIPNLAGYLGQTQNVFNQKMAESPELRAWWSGHASSAGPILEKLRTASEYLGEEIVVTGFTTPDGKTQLPVFFAETKRPGFAEFLQRQHLPAGVAVEERNGFVAFGPHDAVAAFASSAFAAASGAPAGGFQNTPFYARIDESYKNGAGLLLSADLAGMGPRHALAAAGGARYFIAEEKEVNRQMEARAALGFDGPRTGMAAWLAAPSPMGSLDYVSPEATIVTAFVVKSPAAIVDGLMGLQNGSAAASTEKSLGD